MSRPEKPEKPEPQELNVNLKVNSDFFNSINKQISESEKRIIIRLRALERMVSNFANLERKRDEKMADQLDDVYAAAEKGTTVGLSIVALVDKLLLREGVDPTRRAAIVALLNQNNATIEEKVLANTPQEPTE